MVVLVFADHQGANVLDLESLETSLGVAKIAWPFIITGLWCIISSSGYLILGTWNSFQSFPRARPITTEGYFHTRFLVTKGCNDNSNIGPAHLNICIINFDLNKFN